MKVALKLRNKYNANYDVVETYAGKAKVDGYVLLGTNKKLKNKKLRYWLQKDGKVEFLIYNNENGRLYIADLEEIYDSKNKEKTLCPDPEHSPQYILNYKFKTWLKLSNFRLADDIDISKLESMNKNNKYRIFSDLIDRPRWNLVYLKEIA